MRAQDIPAVHRLLARLYRRRRAPVADLVAIQGGDPFKTLVAALLSTRTKDETTAAVCGRLFQEVKAPDDFDALPVARLERLIYPIGFYKTKARQLKRLPGALRSECGGRIPETLDGLCRLPGVGRKVANLVLADAFGQAAICVDVHVHRICNRLGLIRTRAPYDTEMALRRILPERCWRTWNGCLVAFGQTTCLPRRPRCSGCPLYRYCDRVGVSAA